MPFDLQITVGAKEELKKIRIFDRQAIRDAIDVQLVSAQTNVSRNKKPLPKEITADFQFDPPLWELRVGEFRVFYDVNTQAGQVTIRAIRSKPPEQTTKDVLHEGDGG